MGETDQYREFQPADSYDGYYALLYGAGNSIHVVDTTTFDNFGVVISSGGGEYEGFTANIGQSDTLCGHNLTGRMIPLDTDTRVTESRVCGTCLRSLRARTDHIDESDGGTE